MKDYFASRLWLAVALPVTCFPILMMGAMAYGSFITGVNYKVVTGLLILALMTALLWWASFPLRKPIVRIAGSRIEVLNAFGNRRVVENPHDYVLVLASTWVGFRRKGQNDIIVEKGRFSKKTWELLVHHVQQLPFASVA